MRKKIAQTTRVVGAALLVVALASLGLAGSASAKLTGEFTKFEQCPCKTAGVYRCVYTLNPVAKSSSAPRR